MGAEYSGGLASLKGHNPQKSVKMQSMENLKSPWAPGLCVSCKQPGKLSLSTTSLFSWVCGLNAVCKTLKRERKQVFASP